MKDKNTKISKTTGGRSYEDMTHLYGRIWILSALGMIFAYPIVTCIYYDAWPGIVPVLKGLVGVAPIFWTVGLIEVLTFVPMLGTAGSYLAFVTGNLTNLKVPAALTAMENARVKPGTEEGEVISTIAVATSSIVTTVIIAVGVALLVPLTPILNSPTLKPAFDNILPALFGGLAVVCVCEQELEDIYCAARIYGGAVPVRTFAVRFCGSAGTGRCDHCHRSSKDPVQ